MSPHSLSVPTIAEALSETDPVSGTESLLSDTSHTVDQNATLDDLFAELKQQTPDSEKSTKTGDEFQEIRLKIAKLPQIEANLEAKLASGTNSSKYGGKAGEKVARISDPVAAVTKSATSQREDAGSKWFHMKQPEITAAMRQDLMVIKQRAALDPKRHYKKDKWEIPKYFETGTIIQGNTEFYSSRMNKRDRGRTLVEEVLNDKDTSKYFKRVYSEIQTKKTSGKKGHYKKLKAMRRKY